MRISLDALIPMEKLTSYLLVAREWDDKSKFLVQAAFTRENPHLLLAGDPGAFLRAEGELTGSNGRTLEVVTIWLRSRVDGRVRFVTLKPWKEKKS